MDITVFADLIKVRMEMKSYWIMVGPNSNERVLVRDKQGCLDTETAT